MTKVNGLLVMDVDSTLIQEEGIDLLGEEAGVGEKIADITARAMNGELDFKQALDERVGLLKGLPESIFDKVLARMHFTNGAEKLVNFIIVAIKLLWYRVVFMKLLMSWLSASVLIMLKLIV